MTTQHTPGPWIAVNERLVRGLHGEAVAATCWTDQMPVCIQHEANARLIAAAPALLDALEMASRVIEDNDLDEGMAGEYEIITDAITQAKGEN